MDEAAGVTCLTFWSSAFFFAASLTWFSFLKIKERETCHDMGGEYLQSLVMRIQHALDLSELFHLLLFSHRI